MAVPQAVWCRVRIRAQRLPVPRRELRSVREAGREIEGVCWLALGPTTAGDLEPVAAPVSSCSFGGCQQHPT